MLSALLTILGSGTFGSLIGGLFAFLNKKSDLQAKQMDLDQEARRWAHDLSMRDKDLEYAKAEAAARKDVAIVEGEATIEAARMAAIAKSQESENVTAAELEAAGGWKWALVLSSAYRKGLRSLLTTVVGGAAIVANFAIAWHIFTTWDKLGAEQQMTLALQSLAWVSAQASMMFSYWFMSRGTASGPAK